MTRALSSRENAAARLRLLMSLRGALATKQSIFVVRQWIASRSLSSGAHSRDPLARNDGSRLFESGIENHSLVIPEAA
jgi:hypothetical protein